MTRLRLRKNDPLRGMTAEFKKLPWPGRIERDVVFRYGDFYQSVVFNALYRRQATFKGDFVFHYTSVDVFKKLIAPGADLLMTRYNELNDDSEFEYGWLQIISALEWQCGIPKGKTELFICEKKNICAEGAWIPWIMSFSEFPDALSQWGMYTDRKRGGCSIAFDFREMNYTVEKLRMDENRRFDVYFLPCLYDRHEINRVWKLWCEQHRVELGKIASLTYRELKAQRADITQPLMPDLLMLAAIIKHQGFEAEHEWRLMVRSKSIAEDISSVFPFILNGKHRYGFNMCFAKTKPIYTMKWIRGVGASPQPVKSLYDRFWELFDDFCNAGRKQWETGAWMSEIPYNGK